MQGLGAAGSALPWLCPGCDCPTRGMSCSGHRAGRYPDPYCIIFNGLSGPCDRSPGWVPGPDLSCGLWGGHKGKGFKLPMFWLQAHVWGPPAYTLLVHREDGEGIPCCGGSRASDRSWAGADGPEPEPLEFLDTGVQLWSLGASLLQWLLSLEDGLAGEGPGCSGWVSGPGEASPSASCSRRREERPGRWGHLLQA